MFSSMVDLIILLYPLYYIIILSWNFKYIINDIIYAIDDLRRLQLGINYIAVKNKK